MHGCPSDEKHHPYAHARSERVGASADAFGTVDVDGVIHHIFHEEFGILIPEEIIEMLPTLHQLMLEDQLQDQLRNFRQLFGNVSVAEAQEQVRRRWSLGLSSANAFIAGRIYQTRRMSDFPKWVQESQARRKKLQKFCSRQRRLPTPRV